MSTLSQFFPGKLKSQDFTSSGTFTVPAGVTSVWVTMTGGGASGSGDHEYRRTAGGGSGSYCFKRPVAVTPGANVTVTIGAGGAAVGTWGATPGNNGSASSFGSVTVAGGIGGGKYNDGRITGVGGGNGGASALTSSPNIIFLPATSAFGSRGGLTHNTGGGGGGGGLFGEGTDGTYMANASAAASNSGAGGGGATAITAYTYASGAGGSGRCVVEWFE